MPELPEVTTIVKGLNKHARGRIIRDFSCDTPKMLLSNSRAFFKREIAGKKFLRFSRKGKYILAHLGKIKGRETHVLIWHMRMTGHLLFRDEKKEAAADREYFADPRNQHIRCQFFFEDGSRLDYSDVRKFGTLKLVNIGGLAEEGSLLRLGPDALKTKWTAQKICRLFHGRNKPVKQLLLDQTVVAGIGNIYADEILWRAKINPLTPGKELKEEQCKSLARTVTRVLKQAVENRGTSVDDFRDIKGRKGEHAKVLRVYKQEGKKCFRCGTKIAKIVSVGRGTHLCPRCQVGGNARTNSAG